MLPARPPGVPDWAYRTATGQDTGGMFGGRLDGAKAWLFGGKATQGMPTQPQTAGYQRDYLQNDFMNRSAPTMNTAQADQARAQQSQLAQMLFDQSRGLTPGAGELAVQRQANNALAAQASQAQMARGAGAGMAARTAARNSADIGTNAAGQAGIAQMQDQQAAQNQLAGLLGQTRGQDIQTAGANQQAQLAQQQLQLGGLAQLLGVDQAALQQDLARRNLKQGDKGMLPSLLQIGGQIGAAAMTGGASAAVPAAAAPSAPGYSGSSAYSGAQPFNTYYQSQPSLAQTLGVR